MHAKTLTIVISDIKGYTERQSRSSRQEIEAHVERHRSLLAPIFTAYGGRIVKSMGDAFLVVFESPTDAVLAAVQVQKSLSVENARAPAPTDALLVRIAVSTGEVSVDESGDVFGEPVNLAARLEGIAEAGTIYLAETTFLSMNRNEIPAFEVGHRVFKGIADEVKVYRILDDFISSARVLSIEEIRRIARGAVSPALPAGSRRGRVAALVAAAVIVVGAGVYLASRGSPAPPPDPGTADAKDALDPLKLTLTEMVARMANAPQKARILMQQGLKRRIDELASERRFDDAERAARAVMESMPGSVGPRDMYLDLVRRDIEVGGPDRLKAHVTEDPPVWRDTHIDGLAARGSEWPHYRWMRAVWLVATEPARAETLDALEAVLASVPDARRDAALLELVRSASLAVGDDRTLAQRYVAVRERMEKAAATPDPAPAMDAPAAMGGSRSGRGTAGMGGG